MKQEFSTIPLYAWIIIGTLLLSESIWLFRDAQKHKTIPWLWGLWALTSFPTPLVVYLIVVRKVFKKSK
jgi:hypothetical protein